MVKKKKMASKRLLVGAVTPGRPVRHREASSSWDDVECGTRHRRSKKRSSSFNNTSFAKSDYFSRRKMESFRVRAEATSSQSAHSCSRRREFIALFCFRHVRVARYLGIHWLGILRGGGGNVSSSSSSSVEKLSVKVRYRKRLR